MTGGVAGGRTRWVICALLFFATTINYIDRQIIAILKPTLVAEFGWTDERTYAAIVFSFQLAYAIGLLLAGRIMDKLGTRLGLALAVVLWSVAAIAHAGADWFPGLALPTLHLHEKTGLTVVLLTSAAAGFALARFSSASARRATSRPPSRRSPSGSRRRSARSPPASSTPAPTSARC